MTVSYGAVRGLPMTATWPLLHVTKRSCLLFHSINIFFCDHKLISVIKMMQVKVWTVEEGTNEGDRTRAVLDSQVTFKCAATAVAWLPAITRQAFCSLPPKYSLVCPFVLLV